MSARKSHALDNHDCCNSNFAFAFVFETLKLDLQARETKRLDALLKVAMQSQTVLVEETGGAVVTTDVSNLSETKTGKRFLSTSNTFTDNVLGGWELGGVIIVPSGPFLTPYDTSADPAGTNQVNTAYFSRPDVVAGVSPYAHGQTSPDGPLFLNPNAFTIPGNAIGRFGNAGVGSVVGPGTRAVSMSLIKTVKFTEGLRLQFGAEVANLLNHRNYEPPSMAVDTTGYGTLTGLQTAEGAGPRSVS